jgi:TolB-like protein/DNA-binding SARP family transcriptional activator
MPRRAPKKSKISRPQRDREKPIAAPAATAQSGTKFRLSLLGPFLLAGPQGPVNLTNKKLCGLLGYLAVAGPGPHSRERLTTLLWGSHFEAQARQNFRQALTRLRRSLGEDILFSSDESVALKPGAVACDVDRFESLVHEDSTEALRGAVALYAGEFLANVTIKEDSWVEWLATQRTKFETMAVGAMVRLAEKELELNRTEDALAAANQAVSIDRLREDAHRLVIRALVASGRRAEALKHFDQLADFLKSELSIEPDEVTQALAAELRRPQATPAVVRDGVLKPPLPERTSIAVLAFANMSGVQDQEYFADGFTEDIITALSKWRWFVVIARNSTFAFKGKPTLAKEIGEALGARYVLEGSVRKEARRVRITAQLIEAATDRHVWADRYDRELRDIFAVQDEITQAVVTAIDPAIRVSELDRVTRKAPESLDAWDHFLRGSYYHHLYRKRDMLLALEHLHRAIEIDPPFAAAHARLSLAYGFAATFGYTPNVRETLEMAAHEGKIAIALDGFDSSAHAAASYAFIFLRQHDSGLEAGRRAVELNSNYHLAHLVFGMALLFAGTPLDAIPAFERAARLSPLDPTVWAIHGLRAFAHYTARQYEAAIDAADKALIGTARLRGCPNHQNGGIGSPRPLRPRPRNCWRRFEHRLHAAALQFPVSQQGGLGERGALEAAG